MLLTILKNLIGVMSKEENNKSKILLGAAASYINCLKILFTDIIIIC